MVAVAAGLVLLAYWVGHRRGASEAIAAVDAERRAEQVLVDDGRRGSSKVVAVLTGVGPKSAVNTLPKRSDGVTTVPPVDDDPRVEGLNYFVLARDSLAGANRLLKFLGEQGVEAAAIKGDNATTYKVVAIGEAFTREELGNGRFKAFRRRLVEIGRRWEENFDGVVSFEKQGMYAERHRPMTGPVTVVTRRMIP